MKAELERQVAELTRGAKGIIDETSFRTRLAEAVKKGAPLKIKAGFDPSVPDLHLGHTVLLHKMRQFQEFGHEVIFLIGDFTGLIGDPSGKNVTRPALTREEINANAETYKQQVFKILDAKKTRVDFNSRWMDAMTSADFVRLTSMESVARMLERDDFEKRYKSGRSISIHEFLYPLIQGYDSVALQADVELGGTDQRFNLLMGRQIQKEYKQKPQDILMMPLLVGTDGIEKMSKSLNNYIGITEPPADMFGKIMSISDELMWKYYELLSAKGLPEIHEMKAKVEGGKLHPKEVKVELGREITALYWDDAEAKRAVAGFDTQFRQGVAPEDLPILKLDGAGVESIIHLVKDIAGAAKSNGEVRRLVAQNGIKIDDEVVKDYGALELKTGQILKVGKKRWFRLEVV